MKRQTLMIVILSIWFLSCLTTTCKANETGIQSATSSNNSLLYGSLGLSLGLGILSFRLQNKFNTEQKKTVHLLEEQKKLMAQNKKLLRSNQSLEQFAHVTSHDLKEPLRSISCYAGLLKRRYLKDLDEEALEYGDYIIDSAKRMYQLLEDVMNYSRLNQNEGKKNQIIDVNNVVNTAVLNLQTEIKKNEAEIKVINELPQISGNETQMVQLFQNLLSNAIKFRNGKAPNIKIDCQELNGNYTFMVEDNGIGIPEQYHQKIFEVFKQVDTPKKEDGNGIGLSICTKIVENMEGKMWLQSKEGKGTKFFFTLPTNSEN